MSYHERLDPEIREALDAVPIEQPDYHTMTHDDLIRWRAELAAAPAAVVPALAEGRVAVHDRHAPGQPDVRLRIYHPADRAGPLPGLYWIHGGGMIIGSVDTDGLRMSAFAEQLGCVVVAVEYRLAPEHPYPAAVEDCYTGLAWTAEHAEELGILADRLVIGGSSAGGGLAAATTLLARDRGGPRLAFQFLECPMLDDRNETPSSREFTEAIVWDRAGNHFGWAAVLGDRAGTADVPAYAAPGRATDLAGLPPTYVDVGELEVLRDECVEYALRLMRSGVSTELHVFPGAYHGFTIHAPQTQLGGRAVATQLAALRRAMEGGSQAPVAPLD